MEEHFEEVLKDKYHLSYILFYILGVVTVIPSNFFTTATDYWMYKFRDVNSTGDYNTNNKTALQAEFTSDYNIVSGVAYALTIIITSRFIRQRLTILHRTLGCLGTAIFLFILTCIFVTNNTDSWQRGFFSLTLVIGFFLNAVCAMLMVTIYETALKFPQGYIPPIFSGQAIGGIFAALAQILALAAGGGAETTGLTYFIIGLLFIVFCLVNYVASWQKSDFFKHYLNKKVEAKKLVDIDKSQLKARFFSAVSKTKFYMGSMVVTLACTSMLHPGVITLVDSVDKGNGKPWNDTYFGPVINFFLYFVFDYIGREVALVLQKPKSGLVLLVLSLIRVSLVPMILFCNARPRNHLSVVFDVDGVYVLFLLIFAFSNGFIVNSNLTQVPQVTDEKERPFAMLGILILMVLSLAVSAPISTALVKAL